MSETIKYEQRHERTRAKSNFSSKATIKNWEWRSPAARERKGQKAAGRQRKSSRKAGSSGKGRQKSKSHIKIQTKVWQEGTSANNDNDLSRLDFIVTVSVHAKGDTFLLSFFNAKFTLTTTRIANDKPNRATMSLLLHAPDFKENPRLYPPLTEWRCLQNSEKHD